MGEDGKHLRVHGHFRRHPRARRSRSAATGGSGSRPDAGRRDLPAGAKRLERGRGAAAAAASRPAVRAARDRGARRAEDYLASVLAELDELATRAIAAPARGRAATARRDATLDRRGESALAVLADALCAGGPVLAVCADVPRRLRRTERARRRICADLLSRARAPARDRRRIRADRGPRPAGSRRRGTPSCTTACGFTHLAWGAPELRFAEQMHELEYGLRASLVALYRGLRTRERVAGEELEHLLRGDGPHGRPPRLAARLVRVLAELELVSLDRDLPALAIAGDRAHLAGALSGVQGVRNAIRGRTTIPEQRKSPTKRLSRPRGIRRGRPAPRRMLVRGRRRRSRGGRADGEARSGRSRAAAAGRPGRRRRRPERGRPRRAHRGRAQLLADLFAIVEEHADEAAVDGRPRRGSRRRSSSRACTTPTSARKSGEDFIIHPVGVAKICAGHAPRHRDAVRGAAARHRRGHVARRWRRSARRSARRSPAWSTASPSSPGITFQSRDEAQAENYRKMMVAMATDIRVILIKLADRLHNMRTIDGDAQAEADREGHARRSTSTRRSPTGSASTRSSGSSRTSRSRRCTRASTTRSRAWSPSSAPSASATSTRPASTWPRSSTSSGIEAEISGRAKHFYSIYSKMTKKGREFNEIYDLTAMRVIVGSVKDCYGAVGVIHSLWKPLPGRFKDFIAMPKFNMYQSLHTTVIGPEGRPLEIQIRTREMHEMAEYGDRRALDVQGVRRAAARPATDSDGKLKWLRSLLDWQQERRRPARSSWRRSRSTCSRTRSSSSRRRARSSRSPPARRRSTSPTRSTPTSATAASARRSTARSCRCPTSCSPATSSRCSPPSASAARRATGWRWSRRPARATRSGPGSRPSAARTPSTPAASCCRSTCKKQGLPAQKIVGSPLLADVIREMGFRKADDFYIALGGAKISPKVVVNKVMQRLKQGEAAEAEPTAADDLLQTARAARSRRPTLVVAATGSRSRAIDDVMLRLAKCCRPVPGRPDRRLHLARPRDHDPPRGLPERGGAAQGPRALHAGLLGRRRRDRRSGSRSRSTAGTATACSRTCRARSPRPGINILEARCTVNHPMVKNRFVVEVGDTHALDQAISRAAQHRRRCSTPTASRRAPVSRTARNFRVRNRAQTRPTS